MNERQLRELGDDLYGKKGALQTLWQEIAAHFYVERADFTYQRYLGDEYADHLSTSFPLLVRRQLGNEIGAMLRPYNRDWFHQTVEDENRLSLEAKRWLQEKTTVQRRAMYHRKTMFSRAAKESDHDFACFGQAVMQIRPNREQQLIYRNWHLRDCAWQEDENGNVGFFSRKWKPRARDLTRLFPRAGTKVEEIAAKHPMQEIDVRHMMVPSDMWDGPSRQPFVSIYFDAQHDHLIEAEPQPVHDYAVPRWSTVSGTQYAYSPATICALPDARLIQAMTYTLLEAGEKIVNPPMIATTNVVKSDVAMYAGAINWVDRDYDERLGDALRPMTRETRGMPLSRDMLMDQRAQLTEAFYLNKLGMPVNRPEMTAFEVGQWVQEYIRSALPIFEPMEAEYNGQVCDLTFEWMLRLGQFGAISDIPTDIRDRGEVTYRYESPLHDAIEAQLGAKFGEARGLVDAALVIDETAGAVIDGPTALREALEGIGTPMSWLRDPVEEEDVRKSLEARRTAAELMPALKDGAQALAAVPGAGGPQAA